MVEWFFPSGAVLYHLFHKVALERYLGVLYSQEFACRNDIEVFCAVLLFEFCNFYLHIAHLVYELAALLFVHLLATLFLYASAGISFKCELLFLKFKKEREKCLGFLWCQLGFACNVLLLLSLELLV